MKFAAFFVDRPIFAGVVSLIVFMVGLISVFQLPVSEYPEVVPPSVLVRASFPGANPVTIAETVASPLEDAINGVDNLLYMSSQSTNDGQLQVTVTFKIGTDPDIAQMQVQNRIGQALPRLPDEVRRLGVTTEKSSADLTMVVHITSPNDRYDSLYLRNYAELQIIDRLKRIPGVGSALIFGSGDYAMRIWLTPDLLDSRNITAAEVIAAVREQNVQVADMTAKAPTIDTGTAASGIIDARQVCKNKITTNTTRATASSSVVITALIESRTKTVGS